MAAREQDRNGRDAAAAQGAAKDAEAGVGMGYEQARDELVDVVRRLEAGGSSLEESLALWERGEELAGVCRRLLEGARARLDAVLAEEPEEAGRAGAGAPGAGGDR